MAQRKAAAKKLVAQLTGMNIAAFEALKNIVDEVAEIRKPEIVAREEVSKASKERGLKIKDVDFGVIEVNLVQSEKAQKAPVEKPKKQKYFWVVGEDLILTTRMAKIRELKKSGANIQAYDELSDELKERADLMLSAN